MESIRGFIVGSVLTTFVGAASAQLPGYIDYGFETRTDLWEAVPNAPLTVEQGDITQGGSIAFLQSDADGWVPPFLVRDDVPLTITIGETSTALGDTIGVRFTELPTPPGPGSTDKVVMQSVFQPIALPTFLDSSFPAPPFNAAHARWLIVAADDVQSSYSFFSQIANLGNGDVVRSYFEFNNVANTIPYHAGLLVRVNEASDLGSPGANFSIDLSGYGLFWKPIVDVVHVAKSPADFGTATMHVTNVEYSPYTRVANITVEGVLGAGDNLLLLRGRPGPRSQSFQEIGETVLYPYGAVAESGGQCTPPAATPDPNWDCRTKKPPSQSGCPDSVAVGAATFFEPVVKELKSACGRPGDDELCIELHWTKRFSISFSFEAEIFGQEIDIELPGIEFESPQTTWKPDFEAGEFGNGQCKTMHQITYNKQQNWEVQKKLFVLFGPCIETISPVTCGSQRYVPTVCSIP